MSLTNVSMTVNGKSMSADVEPRTLLIHYLRENLGLRPVSNRYSRRGRARGTV